VQIQELIHEYLKSKETSWSKSTQESERFRLKSCGSAIQSEPRDLYERLSRTSKPYAIKTSFIRLGEVYEFGIQRGVFLGPNVWKQFIKEHANLFKHAYTREKINVTFEEAKELIAGIQNQAAREHASYILNTGLRISESYSASDYVKGKGGKTSKVFGPSGDGIQKVPESTLRFHLAKVGLKPHSLRKLAATKAAERGAELADLCEIFGWSSVATASIYLQAKRDDKLTKFMEG
jgi:hypothetical protein